MQRSSLNNEMPGLGVRWLSGDYWMYRSCAALACRLVVAALIAWTPAMSAAASQNRCSLLKVDEARIAAVREIVIETTHPGSPRLKLKDANWCEHARTMIESRREQIAIIEGDKDRCHRSDDGIKRLKDALHGLSLRAEGCN